jgi:hypothetical protein
MSVVENMGVGEYSSSFFGVSNIGGGGNPTWDLDFNLVVLIHQFSDLILNDIGVWNTDNDDFTSFNIFEDWNLVFYETDNINQNSVGFSSFNLDCDVVCLFVFSSNIVGVGLLEFNLGESFNFGVSLAGV